MLCLKLHCSLFFSVQVSESGIFSDLGQLKSNPAHLAVFLHYLLSNSDPSPLVSDLNPHSTTRLSVYLFQPIYSQLPVFSLNMHFGLLIAVLDCQLRGYAGEINARIGR